MLVHNLVDLLITVLFQLRVVHGGHAVAQGLLRGQNGPACKPGIAADHVAHVGPVDEKQVDVSSVGLVIAVALPVTGDLLSQIEHAVIGIVVEQTERTAVGLIHPDVEGDVLVHGVAGLGIVADGVLGAHAETAELFVKVSRLLAEAVKVILLPIHAGVMGEASQVVLFEGPLRQIAVKGLAVFIEKPEGEGLFLQNQPEGCRLKAQGLFVLRAAYIQGLDALPLTLKQGIEAIFPRGGDKGVGGLVKFPVEVYTDADDIVRKENQQRVCRIRMQQPAVFGFLVGTQAIYQHFGLPYIPIRSKSSKLTVRVASFFGFAYLTSTARLDWL